MKLFRACGFAILLLVYGGSQGADWRANNHFPTPTPVPPAHRYCDNFEAVDSLADGGRIVKPKASATGAGYLGVPGMGDLLSLDNTALSFIAVQEQPNVRIVFRHAFKVDPALNQLILSSIDNTRYFKFDNSSKFYLLEDGQKYSFSCSDYHVGTWGDDFIGHYAYETMTYDLPLTLLQSMAGASRIAGQLTPKATLDDDNYSKIFTFNHDLNDYITSFLFVLTGK
jgi:hypothetical protein